ncbi:MAG: hypothetical protein ABNH00_13550 [Dokdonia sp.]|jgi:hypothetical protein
MKNEQEHALDKWSAKHIKEAGVEKPSSDFTAQVMQAVEKASEKPVLVYKPLISRIGWLCIAFTVCALLAYTLFTSTSLETSIGVSRSVEQQLEQLTFLPLDLEWQVPSSLTYGMLAVALWMGLEISLGKKRFQ